MCEQRQYFIYLPVISKTEMKTFINGKFKESDVAINPFTTPKINRNTFINNLLQHNEVLSLYLSGKAV